ncbi:hypothetical protein KDA_19190 [Dictyobacter alpinus]|uniref:Translation initiation factor beta propellor-like domain-containing protein n=1 Tax=Dictyobacter alpinus TaxID=2014873 RepID=A0A402B515_9CHLR|nr:WD40 repeat domain-containing protein [Dictyobacter alpinus]GCE26435.1 hypothetical protein KDA_19190 [Dictyobacter alpinus]
MLNSEKAVNRMSRRAAMLTIAGVAGTAGLLLFGYDKNSASASGGPPPTPIVPTPTPNLTLLTYRGHTSGIVSVVWSPGSQRVASSDQNGSIQVWNASTGKLNFVCANAPAGPTRLAWSANGKYIAGANGSNVYIWNGNTGALLKHFKVQSTGVTSLAFSPGGQRIATGSYDRTVQIWQVTTGAHLLTYNGHNVAGGAPVVSLSWSPNGTQIVSSSSLLGGSGESSTSVKVWNTTTGKDVFVYDASHPSNAVAWSPSGSLIASEKYVNGSETIQLWSPKNSSGYGLIISDPLSVQKIAWAPSSQYVAFVLSSYQGVDPRSRVEILSAAGKSFMLDYTGHQPNVRDVAWSPDGSRLASGADDKTVQIWQAPT